MLCWGGFGSSSGQLGTDYLAAPAISSCGSASCLALSSASYVVFSDTAARVVDVSASLEHTCVLFEIGKTLCFGSGLNGRIGTDGTLPVSGPGGPPLAAQPRITLGDELHPVGDIFLGHDHSCALRCDGAVLCFGRNVEGGLGRGTSADYGDTLGHMSTLAPVAFDPSRISLAPLGCPARITALTESSGKLGGAFSSLVTTYLFAVKPSVASLAILSAATYPVGCAVVANSQTLGAIFPLDTNGVNKVRIEIESE